jgi:predicted alpha-1,2-mannosidase
MAKALGKDDDYEMFMKRAGFYHNLYDPSTKFMRPKMHDGSWLPAIDGHKQEIIRFGDHTYYKYFDPLLVGRRPNRHYTESNAWQYIWSVQHEVQGLIDLMDGNENFTERLDAFYNMSPVISPPKYVGVVGTVGQHVQGNQPSHHVPYLYNYAGKPWKTQETIRKVLDLYRTGPGGICGNEDMGSLTSWYLFSAMGFYPVTPGSTVYAIGSPVLGEVTIKLKNNKTFRIIAENTSDENKYIQSAMLNGKPLNRSWIDHSEIMAGGTLKFIMGPDPKKNWASGKQNAPYSASK